MDSVPLGKLVGKIMMPGMTQHNETRAETACYRLLCPAFNISILLPTRGRSKVVHKSLKSLIEKAHDLSKIELIIVVDNDDVETIDYFKNVIIPELNLKNIHLTLLLCEPMGYGKLHKYVNLAADMSTGSWLVFWNDDAVMLSQDWDKTIMEHQGEFKLLAFTDNHKHPYSIFPIVPREWYILTGILSEHAHTDAWLSQIEYTLDIYQRIDVNVLHNRYDLTGDNNDQTYKNRVQWENNPSNVEDLNHPAMSKRRWLITARIAWYLSKIGQPKPLARLMAILTENGNPWDILIANDPHHFCGQFNVQISSDGNHKQIPLNGQ